MDYFDPVRMVEWANEYGQRNNEATEELLRIAIYGSSGEPSTEDETAASNPTHGTEPSPSGSDDHPDETSRQS